MSQYYTPRRTTGLFNPKSTQPFKLSRSKIDLFLNCPRCFYLDRRLGVGQPPGYPFSLNSAVDKLLKKEFDVHRTNQTPHPLMVAAGLDAKPFAHPKIDTWRENFEGIQYVDPGSNFLVTGAVDDLWVNAAGELIIVDYKATSKAGQVSLDADWQIGYKRQMEVYQWLFRKNNFAVQKTGYFVYCNGNADNDGFHNRLEFEISLIPYDGDDSWVAKALLAARDTLMSDTIPESSHDCDYCKYRAAVWSVEGQVMPKTESAAPIAMPVVVPDEPAAPQPKLQSAKKMTLF